MVWDAKNGALCLVPSIITLEMHRVWLAEACIIHTSAMIAALGG